MIKLPKENIEDFEKLGYFKYAAPDDMEELKKEIERCIREYKVIYSVYFPEPDKKHVAKDYRFIYCDHEDLIEWQAKDTLHILSFSFEKMQLPFAFKNIMNGFDEKKDLGFSKIEINGKIYVLYSTDWSQYAYDFVKIVNDQLEILDSRERLYLISPGNDGNFIFLDDVLKEYFDKHVELSDRFTPMDADAWIEKYKEEYTQE